MFGKKSKKIKKNFVEAGDVERLDRIKARPSNNVGYKVVDGKAVILNLEDNSYFSLDDIGTEIWQSLKENKSLAEIAEETADIFEVDYKEACRDLIELVNEFIEADLLELR